MLNKYILFMPLQKKCPKCSSFSLIKSGIIGNRQRYKCKECAYYFTVDKIGKEIDNYFVVKALQLYIEGLSFRESERILGISHVTISNWIKKYNIKRPINATYHPTYKILSESELQEYFKSRENLKGKGMIITEVGDKFMLIKWERFKD